MNDAIFYESIVQFQGPFTPGGKSDGSESVSNEFSRICGLNSFSVFVQLASIRPPTVHCCHDHFAIDQPDLQRADLQGHHKLRLTKVGPA